MNLVAGADLRLFVTTAATPFEAAVHESHEARLPSRRASACAFTKRLRTARQGCMCRLYVGNPHAFGVSSCRLHTRSISGR